MSRFLCGTAEYTVAVDETDCLGRLKPSAWMQYMQDLATSHADRIGVGFHAMYERGLLWVLTKISARIFRAPAIGERIYAETYPKKPGRVECLRDFYFYDAERTPIAVATTVWCFIDPETRRIRRAAEHFPFDDDAYRADDAVTDLGNVVLPDGLQEAYRGTVRFSDTDRNRHLNNARYGDMLLDACPEELLLANEITAFDLHFVRELRMGASYRVGFLRQGEYGFVETADEAGQVFAARCRLGTWQGGIR